MMMMEKSEYRFNNAYDLIIMMLFKTNTREYFEKYLCYLGLAYSSLCLQVTNKKVLPLRVGVIMS
jgi:hypothetical protein